jgi:RimJ/RimL family protein N-acetyltransferase
MYVRGEKVIVRDVEEKDLPTLWELIYGEAEPEWKKWDAPYFPLERTDYPTFYQKFMNMIAKGLDHQKLIETIDGTVIGTVTYYWEHEPSRWLEAGIVIYVPDYWSGGYGTEALTIWVDHLFQQLPVARVGLTTWSGNERMMRVGEKLGMQLEGRMRKCPYYNGQYYDSIRMGILREEWAAIREEKLAGALGSERSE